MKIPSDKIVAYIKANFDYKTRKGGKEYLIPNPIMYDSGRHLNVNPEDGGICHDWRGDEQWAGYNEKTGKINKRTFTRLIQRQFNCSYFQAVKIIIGDGCDPRAYFNVKDEPEKKEVIEEAITLPACSEPITGSTSKFAKLTSGWLKTVRAYTDEVIERYQIHHSTTDVVWPYYEFGEIVYWQTRSIFDKVFTFPECPKGKYIYGFDNIEPASYLILTEAIIDQNTVDEQCGATGGAMITEDQVKKIKMLGPKDGIILAPDADVAGLRSILTNGDMLQSAGYRVMYSHPPIRMVDGVLEAEYKDWNEMAVKVDRKSARSCLENHVENLSTSSRLKLWKMITELERASKAIPT